MTSARIATGETVAAALERIALEQMQEITAALQGGDAMQAVYEARKHLKTLRALLRLARMAFPERLFREQDDLLARAGRRLSPLRDVHVQLEMLHALKGHHRPAARHIQRRLKILQERHLKEFAAIRKIVMSALKQSRTDLARWPLDKVTSAVLADGLRRIYKKGREAFHATRQNPSAENLHAWRKKAKALGNCMAFLADIASKKLSRRLEGIKAIGDDLGDDHDLFLMEEMVGREQSAGAQKLTRHVRRRRRKLQKHAFKLGGRIFTDKPSDFFKRLTRRELAARQMGSRT